MVLSRWRPQTVLVWASLVFGLLVLATPAPAGSLQSNDLNRGLEGQPFNVSEYLTRGKINIVEFYSPACPICGLLAPKLESLLQKNTTLVLKRVNVDRPGSRDIDWQSPLARQYEVRSVPQFKIYDSSGQLLADGEKARQMISKLLIESRTI